MSGGRSGGGSAPSAGSAPRRPQTLREALYQGRHWWDAHGVCHQLQDMDLAYLLNVRDFLSEQALWLYEDEACLQDMQRLFGHPLARGAPVATDYASEQAWLRATPLIRALTRQVRRRLWLHLAPGVDG